MTLFTRIIAGEIPGKFVYRDEVCVAFLSIHPLRPGHTLVVPIEPIDHWLDLSPQVLEHLHQVARRIGQAQMTLYSPKKIGLLFAGLEIPHAHLHVVPIFEPNDLDFANANTAATNQELEIEAERLRQALQ